MRIATYTRISTDEDRKPFSLGAQQERLDAYARSQDSWRIVSRYSDQASGATLERDGLKRALKDAAAGVYELLLIYRVDRLSRNVRQLAQLAEELDKVGVALRSATEPFDTSSPAGKMMMQMLGVFAEFERSTIVDRITAGMLRAASQGRWVIGKVPYGYSRDRETKLILPHEPQAAVVRRIFDLYIREQMGSEAIAGLLNDEGHRTKNGVPFSARIVLRILSNPIYVGRVTFQDEEFEGLHESLVDEATFAVAARILEERGNRKHSGEVIPPTTSSPVLCAAGSATAPSSGHLPRVARSGTTTTRAARVTDTARRSVMPSAFPKTTSRKLSSSR